MAVLSGRDRGQLLLLGAVVIGFVIVTLSLTLNGGLYAETIAGEAVDDVSNEETRYLLADIRGDGAWLLTKAIATNPDSNETQEKYVRDNVTVLNQQYGQYYARNDAVVNISVDRIESGTQVHQSNGDFDIPSSGGQVISDGRVRNVTLTIDSGYTNSPGRLVFDDGKEYAIKMNSTYVAVNWTGKPDDEVCLSGATTPPTVNISAATVNGEPCPALDFDTELDDSYEVRFEDGDNVGGSYSITAMSNSGTVAGPNPRDRVYEIYLNVTHRTPTTDYEGTIRVAPGEI